MRFILAGVSVLIVAGAAFGQDSKPATGQLGGTKIKQEKTAPPEKPIPKGARENHPGAEGAKETRVVVPVTDGPAVAFDVHTSELTEGALHSKTAGKVEGQVMLGGKGIDPGTKVSLKVVQLSNARGGTETAVEAEKIGPNGKGKILINSVQDKIEAKKVLSGQAASIREDLSNVSVVYLACDGKKLLTPDEIAKLGKENIKFCAQYEVKSVEKKK